MTKTTIQTHTWQGHPIEYREYKLDTAYAGTTLIHSLDYVFPNGDLRYVAIQAGAIVAVQTDRNAFCNQVVDPLFKGGSCGYFPYFEKRDGGLVYVVPVVPQEVK